MIKYSIFLLIPFLCVPFLYADTNTHLYSTWDLLEVDNAASAWLIKRFVDKEAIFKFYPKGEFITQGIPFDTPDAKLRRIHNMSCFESIIHHYQIKDPKVIYMGKLIHEIEINYWNVDVTEDTMDFKNDLRDILLNNNDKDPAVLLEKAFTWIDSFYEELSY